MTPRTFVPIDANRKGSGLAGWSTWWSLSSSSDLDTHIRQSFGDQRQVGCEFGVIDFKVGDEFLDARSQRLVGGCCIWHGSGSRQRQLDFIDEQPHFRSRRLIDLRGIGQVLVERVQCLL